MKIVGIERMSVQQLQDAVDQGGRFVIYQYCISILVMSFKRSSSIHFVSAGRSKAAKGAPFTALSLVAGWWGFPWGPIWTVATTVKNLGGGVDVTPAVMAQIAPAQPIRAVDAPVFAAPR